LSEPEFEVPEVPANRASGTAPAVLVVDDETMMRTMLARELPRLGFQVTTAESGEEALRFAAAEEFAVAILDMMMNGMDGLATLQRLRQDSPGTEVVMLTGHGTIESAVAAMRAGAFDYLTKPCRLAELAAVLGKAVEHRDLRRENAALKLLVEGQRRETPLIAQSPVMRTIFERLQRAAAGETPILILGESGTGKELVARACHQLSRRSAKPFVVLNCSAIPDTLLESELFGHQRGAFTGATERRLGLMEAADGGTIFLDEIAEMSPAVQAKVLRALESGEIRRVGENRVMHVDVRILAATNKDLHTEISAGRFREDLYYRLNTVVVDLPPLRDRREDIDPLVRHFLRTLPGPDRRPREISPQAMEALVQHSWPGNIRELKNTIEAMLVLASGPRIELADLPPAVHAARSRGSLLAEDVPLRRLEDVVAEYITRAVERCAGNKSQAARILGIDPKTLYKHLKR
jgi:DNA-binding NtrC family response regulator